MTDMVLRPGDMGPGRAPAAVRSAQGRRGPLGYGNGPLIAVGVALGGAVLFGGWGAAQAAMAADGPIYDALHGGTSIQQPTDTTSGNGTVTVTLPDLNGNGVPDQLEAATAPDPEPAAPSAPPAPAQPWRYLIVWGDTLTAISARTDVPIDRLVEENGIENPDLIYAGSTLTIPPAG